MVELSGIAPIYLSPTIDERGKAVTMLIGQRYFGGMLLMSDTKVVDDVERARPDALPGRAKLVILGEHFTVGYYGNASRGIDCARKARPILRDAGPAAARGFLKEATREGDLSFLVADGLQLLVIRAGGELAGDQLWLGDPEPFQSTLQAGSLDPSRCFWTFVDTLNSRQDLPDVGGLPLAVEATAEGHRYKPFGQMMSWNLRNWGADGQEPLVNVLTGDGHYRFELASAEGYGNSVCAAYLPQAGMAFVYAPFLQDRAIAVGLKADGPTFTSRMEAMSASLLAHLADYSARSRFTISATD